MRLGLPPRVALIIAERSAMSRSTAICSSSEVIRSTIVSLGGDDGGCKGKRRK